MRQRRWFGAWAACLLSVLGGCATATRIPVRAERYRIDVHLDPVSSTIVGTTAMDIVRKAGAPVATDGPVSVELFLHPDLEITHVRASGADVRPEWAVLKSSDVGKPAPGESEDGDEFQPARHLVYLSHPVESTTLFVDYRGKLFQDVAAGEKPGEIHNFEMRAHIGTDGVYLADGYWYPQPAHAEHERALAEYVLVADPIDSMPLVAGATPDPLLAQQTGRLAWRSPYPLDGMVLVGGRHEVHRAKHGPTDIELHLKPEQAKQADGLLAAVRKNLDHYQPLIGPYPASQYTIVDNFFSSGFAFPTFTLLSSAVIDMGERAQTTHGYLDHEMLHSWWGNGVMVAPEDGNWCEALASYGANYYGFILDGDAEEARRKRRNYSHFLSRMKPEDDKPLGTFGQEDGCNRSIAYDKGAMVFHMLARKMGQEAFWSAMRRLTREYVGEYASWEDIRRVCENESGADLKAFFDQWVRRGGAPLLVATEVSFHSDSQELVLTVTQGEPAFELDVPLRVSYGDRAEELTVPVGQATQVLRIPVQGAPAGVELDPNYELFRKIPPEFIVPTTASTRYGTAFTSVVLDGEVPKSYEQIRSIFASSFEDKERLERSASAVAGADLAERCALILGDAAKAPMVSAFLGAIEFPIRIHDGSFEFDGVTYAKPEHAFLCTVRQPGVPGGGVTVIYANSIESVPSAFAVPMYDRSLVVFESGRAILRKDFERPAVVPVKQTSAEAH